MIIKKITKDAIRQAIKVLKNGGVIVYPTDTLYGLGADISNKKAVEKVYQIKGRKFNNPLLVLVSSKKDISKLVYLNKIAKKLINKFLPGALTLILKKKKIISSKVSGRKNTVGIRLPNNKTAVSLTKKLGNPITSTSANLAGTKSLTSAQAIYKHFQNKKHQPDLILDVGKIKSIKPSTILDLSEKNIKVLRDGKGVNKIKKYLKI